MQQGVPISERMNQRLRERFFHLATQQFVSQGYKKTSFKELARILDIDRSTLRSYFPDKESFLLYFVEQEMACTVQEAERMSSSKRPAAERLAHILDYLWAYLNENRDLTFLTARILPALSDSCQERIASRQRKYVQILERIIRQGIKRGEFRRVDPRLAAATLYDLVMAPFTAWLLYADRDEYECDPGSRLDIFLQGLQAD
ncbi:MAG: TetR/AcrR family transcriptional regulator C-terminal domain-containing protein [Anaerolineales bacterium]|jgi:TetR/AcrR family fatty acid metabolism transcriptional regulator